MPFQTSQHAYNLSIPPEPKMTSLNEEHQRALTGHKENWLRQASGRKKASHKNQCKGKLKIFKGKNIYIYYIYYSLVDKKAVTGLRKIKDYVKQTQRKTLLEQDLL